MYGTPQRSPDSRKQLFVRAGVAALAAVGVATAFGVVRAGGAPRPAAAGYPVPAGAVFASPTGSDSAAGTIDSPLRTVKAAVAKAPAGGTVVLRGGDYRETVGSITKRVTLQNYGTEAAWLKGTDVMRDWTPDNTGGSAWRATGYTSPFCQNCYPGPAVDPAHPVAGSPDQVFVNGAPLAQVASRGAVTAGTFFVDPGSKALYVGTNPASGTVEVSTRWLAVKLEASAAGSKLLGLRFTGYSPHWNEDQLAAVMDAAPNSLLEGNLFTRTATRALGVFAANVTVQGNSAVDNGGPGGNFNRAHGVVVRGNHFDRNNSEHYAAESGGCGAYCTMAGLKISHTAGVTIDGNTFDGNDGNGFWCDLGCTNGTITGNEANDNTVSAIFWEVSSHATITGNRMAGNARGMKISGSDHATVTGNTFTGNVTQLGMYDDGRSSSTDGYAGGLGLSWDTTDTVLTGNTFSGGTNLLLDTNHQQVGAAQMLAQLGGNTVSGLAKIWWCPAGCVAYQTLAAFHTGTGLTFGGTATTPPTPPAAQYLADPGFEASPLAWRTFGPATVLAQVGTPRSGARALRVGTTGTGTVAAGSTGTPPALRTVAGHRYRASCWVRGSVPVNVRLQVQEYTPSWQRAGNPAPVAAVAGAGGWTQLAVTYTAAKSGNQLPLSVFSSDLAARKATLLVDDCSLTDG